MQSRALAERNVSGGGWARLAPGEPVSPPGPTPNSFTPPPTRLQAPQAAGPLGKADGAATASTPAAAKKSLLRFLVPKEAAETDDLSPLSKFKDYQVVERLVGATPPPPPVPAAAQPGAERIQRSQSGHMAADAAQLVQSLLLALAGAGAPDASLELCLSQLADPEVLALLPDCELARVLVGLAPLLLRYSHARRQWEAPGIGAALAPLQAACQVMGLGVAGGGQHPARSAPTVVPAAPMGRLLLSLLAHPHHLQERLERASLPCDAVLVTAAARFFTRAMRTAGTAVVSDGLLRASARHISEHCRQLGSEVRVVGP